jgi:hypothetical protein
MADSEEIKLLRQLEEVTAVVLPILDEISEIKKLLPEKTYQEITKKLEHYNS